MRQRFLFVALVMFVSIFTSIFLTGDTLAGVVQNGLISYWNFDEGNDAGKDSAGNNDGELMNGPEIDAGKFGNGLKLDGVDDHIKVATLNISPGTYAEITLMAWVFPTSDGTGGQGNRRFLFGHDDGGWDRGLLMQATNWRTGTGNDGTDYWDTGVAVAVNMWQHVALVYSADDIKFYMDGEEHSYGTPGAIGDGNPFLLIGAHPTQARYFQGIIDEVCVYSRPLAKNEIESNMNASGAAVDSSGKLSITWGKVR